MAIKNKKALFLGVYYANDGITVLCPHKKRLVRHPRGLSPHVR